MSGKHFELFAEPCEIFGLLDIVVLLKGMNLLKKFPNFIEVFLCILGNHFIIHITEIAIVINKYKSHWV